MCLIFCFKLLTFLQALHLILSTTFCCLRVSLTLKLACNSILHTFNVSILVYFGLLYLSLDFLSFNLCSHGAPRCHCFYPPLLSLLELTMSHCPHYYRPVSSGFLQRHVAQCPSAQKSKISRKPHHHHSSLWKRPRLQQVIKPKSIEASLAGDTHTATHTRSSDLLHSRPFFCERSNARKGTAKAMWTMTGKPKYGEDGWGMEGRIFHKSARSCERGEDGRER